MGLVARHLVWLLDGLDAMRYGVMLASGFRFMGRGSSGWVSSFFIGFMGRVGYGVEFHEVLLL
jgi:hypothetical protein